MSMKASQATTLNNPNTTVNNLHHCISSHQSVVTSPHLVPYLTVGYITFLLLRSPPIQVCTAHTPFSLLTPLFLHSLLCPSFASSFHPLLSGCPLWLIPCSLLAVTSFPFPAHNSPPPDGQLLRLAVPPVFPWGCLFPIPPPSTPPRDSSRSGILPCCSLSPPQENTVAGRKELGYQLQFLGDLGWVVMLSKQQRESGWLCVRTCKQGKKLPL